METKTFKIEIGGKELKVISKKLAEQASGNILVQYGDTLVMATAVMSDKEREGVDFFPLTVEYEEKFYAAGKILGSRFMRREGKPSDEAILTARFIDRAIRPRFPKDLKREVQVVVTCLSWDKENDPDIIGLIAASLALSISNIPWLGPISIVRVGQIDEKFVLNPSYAEREKINFDLAAAGLECPEAEILGNKKGDNILVNMMEAEGNEVDEDLVLKAIDFAKPYLQELINFQKEITKEIGKEKTDTGTTATDPELDKEIRTFLGDRLEKALFESTLGKLKEADLLKEELIYFISNSYPDNKKISYVKDFFEEEVNRLIHEGAQNGKRTDGRKLNELRNIEAEVGLLPRTHGSGLFTRGQTRALSILTLGAPGDVRLMEGMEISGKKRFMHHYNFPPYCSGETKPMRGPGRREIGHGMLAEKALFPLIPVFDEFPYTIRIVTEILSSNGSTSMASISGSSLALMDAGVPMKELATGISIGLMHDYKGNCKVLTDIQGPEDHHGDMDFKIAGTKNGITAIQLDVKIEGIGTEIIKEALVAGKKARLQILETMSKAISAPRENLSQYAPRIIIMQINPEKIRDVIGSGGKVINEIINECDVLIDIEDTGKIFVTAEKEENANKAVEWIKNITYEVKVGEVFKAKIKRILNFGAFAEFLPGQEGLIHISELAPRRVEKVEDVVNIGDTVTVKVISIDEQGRINLSIKEVKI